MEAKMVRFVILVVLAASTVTAPISAKAKGGTFHLFSARAAQAADDAQAAAHADAPTSIRTVGHVPNLDEGTSAANP